MTGVQERGQGEGIERCVYVHEERSVWEAVNCCNCTKRGTRRWDAWWRPWGSSAFLGGRKGRRDLRWVVVDSQVLQLSGYGGLDRAASTTIREGDTGGDCWPWRGKKHIHLVGEGSDLKGGILKWAGVRCCVS